MSRFVPALKWIDLSDEAGLSLLNDSRYGFDVKDNTMRISIVRGATYPDPEADRGSHQLAYALYPHQGNWKQGLSFRHGLEFNQPLLAEQALIHPGTLPASQSFLEVSPENAVVTTLKKEIGYGRTGFVLRFYEIFGQETEVKMTCPQPVEVWEADLIERPEGKISPPSRVVNFKLKPLEIKTLLLRAE